ncbi:cytochrome c oxidase subunit 4 [Silvibacterium bohemicum]|uniref:Cytochrome c oxidase subunit 4 n=1 Tax=Silvibacterium bohemicum TaxID=1577686 RepID=A0A841JYP8_9BACT|nr:cytochrome C oxidase subunit IV family protein [Silvibacterium bohemicum]MBB6146456.1 cytochrome c oxidase subunit 4 [Silvibacterium bohemicum]
MSAPNEPASDHVHTIVSPTVYAVIFGLLLLCTALTVGASYLEMGIFNPIVALGIAVFKAVIVVLFFMHVKYSSKLTKLTVAAGFFTFIVLITMTLTDYLSRAWGRW